MACSEKWKKFGLFHAVLIVVLGSIVAVAFSYIVLQTEDVTDPIKGKFLFKSKSKSKSTTLNTTLVTSTENNDFLIVDATHAMNEFCYWSGDGLCDDTSNIEECNFDGGDCCLSLINNLHCTECFCFEDESYHSVETTTYSSDSLHGIFFQCSL